MIWEFNDLRGCWAAFCCRLLTPGSPALAVTTVRFPAPLIPALNPVLFAFLCCSSFTSSPRLASVETAFHDLASRGRSSVPALHFPPRQEKWLRRVFPFPILRPVRYAAGPVHAWETGRMRGASPFQSRGGGCSPCFFSERAHMSPHSSLGWNGS